MKSFSVKLDEFFAMKRRGNVNEDFDQGKCRLLIPLYQREYKWKDTKIEGLINDIFTRDKFLGIVILDESLDHYEIVDGQQRITTCYLIMMALYNLNVEHPLEQSVILNIMQHNNAFVLKNDSIGDFISKNDNRLELSIVEKDDIYYQKSTYEKAFRVVNQELEKLTPIQRREFFAKFKDCEFVVLINDTYSNTRPIEQIFLDINEKSQLLDAEDIFKGHCFENYDEAYHQNLKEQWVTLRKLGIDFSRFGYDGLSEYLYLYLLAKSSKGIPENLTVNGKHFLSGKTTDETEATINGLIHYGKSIIRFAENLSNDDYRFADICSNSSDYTKTNDHKMLKSMSKDIIGYKKAQYQKLPFFELIAILSTGSEFQTLISYDQLKRIVTNLYVYTSLFIAGRGKKSKGCIDWSFLSILNESPIQPTEILFAAKKLRSTKVNEFEQGPLFNYANYSFVTSVIDYYDSPNNWLKNRNTQETNFSCEHLVIPDNKQKRILWQNQGNKEEIFLNNSRWDKYKKRTVNYLFLDNDLNESMEHNDIVTKIETMRSWYTTRGIPVPNHVQLVINHIIGMGEYRTLAALKGTSATSEDIKKMYNAFVDAFFGDDNQSSLLSKITRTFKNSFRNEVTTVVPANEMTATAV